MEKDRDFSQEKITIPPGNLSWGVETETGVLVLISEELVDSIEEQSGC